MKRTVKSVFIFLSIIACISCQDKRKQAPLSADEEKSLEKEIVSFFTDRLEGSSLQFSSGLTPDQLDTDSPEEMVWSCWKKANSAMAEDGLPPLQPLSDPAVGKWPLPADLEPSAVMPFYWGAKGDMPENGYPLYLYLHGSGEKEKEWSNGLILGRRFEDSPSVYFIPQIPNMGKWYRWWQKSKQFAWEKLLRLAFLDDSIDPLRVFFFGISEGGYGSQRLASFYADYLAAAGPMAGGEPLKNAPAENCAHIGFSLRTGAEDFMFSRNTLTGYTKEAFDALEKEHPGLYRHYVELIPGMGHGIDYSVTTPWLSGFSRNPRPEHVYWEDFEMDGRHRSGFYNIQVIERPDPELRTRYVMDIEGNTVYLSVDNILYETVETDSSGIELRFSRSYVPAKAGKVRLYFTSDMIDTEKDIVLKVNGEEVFRGKLEASVGNMVNSCALFFDPCRIFRYSVVAEIR